MPWIMAKQKSFQKKKKGTTKDLNSKIQVFPMDRNNF